MSKLKEFMTQPLLKTESARAGIMAVAGGYVLYLGYDMAKAVLSEETTVSPVPALIAAGVLAIGGAGILVYAIRRWYVAYKEMQSQEQAENQEQPEE